MTEVAAAIVWSDLFVNVFIISYVFVRIDPLCILSFQGHGLAFLFLLLGLLRLEILLDRWIPTNNSCVCRLRLLLLVKPLVTIGSSTLPVVSSTELIAISSAALAPVVCISGPTLLALVLTSLLTVVYELVL